MFQVTCNKERIFCTEGNLVKHAVIFIGHWNRESTSGHFYSIFHYICYERISDTRQKFEFWTV